MNIAALPNRFLRLRQVLAIVGLSKSAVYARIKEGSFPKSISLGGTSVAWIEAEVNNWMNARIAARDQSPA
jgi:prophage regulatory protein